MLTKAGCCVTVLCAVACTLPGIASANRLSMKPWLSQLHAPHVAPLPWDRRWRARTAEERWVREGAEMDASLQAGLEEATTSAVWRCWRDGRDRYGRKIWRCDARLFFVDKTADVEMCWLPLTELEGRKWMTTGHMGWVYAHCRILRNAIPPLGPEKPVHYAPFRGTLAP